MSSLLEDAVQAQKDLIAARRVELNAQRAVGSGTNIPKHKKKKYQDAVLAAHIKKRNAQEKAYATFKKLNAVQQAQVYEMVANGETI